MKGFPPSPEGEELEDMTGKFCNVETLARRGRIYKLEQVYPDQNRRNSAECWDS
jgi:hypothetical protein